MPRATSCRPQKPPPQRANANCARRSPSRTRRVEEQEQAIANAQADVAHAQSIIEQATEVHDHPEITESLAGSLARDKAEHAETEREVAQLEAAEDDVRERTRDSRIKFTGAIVCIIAVILVIVLIGLFASK